MPFWSNDREPEIPGGAKKTRTKIDSDNESKKAFDTKNCRKKANKQNIREKRQRVELFHVH